MALMIGRMRRRPREHIRHYRSNRYTNARGGTATINRGIRSVKQLFVQRKPTPLHPFSSLHQPTPIRGTTSGTLLFAQFLGANAEEISNLIVEIITENTINKIKERAVEYAVDQILHGLDTEGVYRQIKEWGAFSDEQMGVIKEIIKAIAKTVIKEAIKLLADKLEHQAISEAKNLLKNKISIMLREELTAVSETLNDPQMSFQTFESVKNYYLSNGHSGQRSSTKISKICTFNPPGDIFYWRYPDDGKRLFFTESEYAGMLFDGPKPKKIGSFINKIKKRKTDLYLVIIDLSDDPNYGCESLESFKKTKENYLDFNKSHFDKVIEKIEEYKTT